MAISNLLITAGAREEQRRGGRGGAEPRSGGEGGLRGRTSWDRGADARSERRAASRATPLVGRARSLRACPDRTLDAPFATARSGTGWRRLARPVVPGMRGGAGGARSLPLACSLACRRYLTAFPPTAPSPSRVLSAGAIGAVVLLMKSDVRTSSAMLRQNIKTIRGWMEQQAASAECVFFLERGRGGKGRTGHAIGAVCGLLVLFYFVKGCIHCVHLSILQ